MMSARLPHGAQHGVVAILLALALLTTAACTAVYHGGGPPTVIYNTPFGTSQVSPGGQQPAPAGNNLAMPPSGLQANPPAPMTNADRNGTYAGAADVLTTGGGMCINNRRVANFRVHGDAVQYGEFQGTVGVDGGLQMVFRNVWITGRFRGGTFRGQLSENGGIGCTYLLALERVGP
jgi:hypothetical protein